ncbi:MAG: D-psicose/D-tagatose/L-ribulose 3-epimerase [Patiriisocius sp.]|jgi:D-psicose/D-tagatose/L-ribulose 3-epimerase
MSLKRRDFVSAAASTSLLAMAPSQLVAGSLLKRKQTMNVKIGMNMLLWGVNITSEHIPVFEGLAKAGFDGVEIPVVGQSTKELAAMRAAVASLGMECTTATFITPDANPIAPDSNVRANALVTLKQRIDETAALGSELLIGGIYQAHKYFVGRGATAQEWDWSASYLRAAGEYAQSKGVRLGLEFLNRFEAFLINTAADAQRMSKDVGLNNVGVLYDTHHANIEDPNPAKVLPMVRNELFHVHLSESHRGTLGTGQVNWEENFAALKAIDYKGWLVIEAFGKSDPAIVNAANIWREAFDSPEQLYTDGIQFIRQNI